MTNKCLASVSLFLFSWLSFPSYVYSDIILIDLLSNETVHTFDDLTASFGPGFPKNGLEGRIKLAHPQNACHPITEAPPVTDQYSWIVMIARGGNCEFADKVIFAQKANFSAAIVHNYVLWEGLTEMGGKNGSKVIIPSTFVGYTSGKELVQRFQTSDDFIVRIKEVDDIDYRVYLWPFAIVVGVCFFMIMVFLVVKFVRDHIRTTVSRLSKKHLKKIPIRKFKKGQYYDTCAICLDEYEDGEKIRILPCDHAYHMKCIDPWLTQNKKTCPVCKRRVMPGKDPNSDSDSDDGGSSRERTPLLRATSQSSHGSILQSGASTSSEPSGRTSDAIDETQGAIGGVGTQSGQPSVKVEQEIGSGEQREARRPRKERREERGVDGNSNLTEEGSEERKTERREKRKRKKEKRREERRARQQDAEAEINGQQIEGEGTITVQAEVQSQRDAEAAAEGYINPSYSESQEVTVPGSGNKRELNEVV